MDVGEKFGSPGWSRTSDFLINSPTGRLTTGAHGDLSWHVLDGLRGGCWPVRRGESRWVGTNVEPRAAPSASAAERRAARLMYLPPAARSGSAASVSAPALRLAGTTFAPAVAGAVSTPAPRPAACPRGLRDAFKAWPFVGLRLDRESATSGCSANWQSMANSFRSQPRRPSNGRWNERRGVWMPGWCGHRAGAKYRPRTPAGPRHRESAWAACSPYGERSGKSRKQQERPR